MIIDFIIGLLLVKSCSLDFFIGAAYYTSVDIATSCFHYDGVYEVLGEIEENFLLQLADEGGFTHGQLDLPQHIERLCEKLRQNKDIALLLLANNADPNFSAKLMKLQACGPVWSETVSSYSPAEYELLVQFISGGAFAMVCHWLESGCQQTPKQVAALMTKVIQNGILPKK